MLRHVKIYIHGSMNSAFVDTDHSEPALASQEHAQQKNVRTPVLIAAKMPGAVV